MAELTYLGHGSFRIATNDQQTIYVDPYVEEGTERPADLVLITHEHHDHNRLDLIELKADSRVIRAQDLFHGGVYQKTEWNGILIEATQAYNGNHDPFECVGYLVTVDGQLLYFAGDTSATAAMKRDLCTRKIDWAFLPCDGIYNMGPKEASRCAATIQAAHTVPVHTDPHSLFDREQAERVQAENRVILTPKQTIKL